MRNIYKKLITTALAIPFLLVTLGFTGLNTAQAATAPNLGVATGYSVFGNAGITETVAQLSHLWGNAGGNGFGNASLIASQVDGTIDAGANATVVGAISAAYGDLAGEAQTGAIDLALSPTVTPGVYNVAATAFNSTLTLNGAGVYIFRSTSSIAQTAGGTMSLTNGATACNVFWQIPTSMTFAAAGSIAGTIITNTGLISFVSGVNLQGRAWAATQVTMANNQITEPTCATTTTPAALLDNTITVFKQVINDNGGTASYTNFPLFVNGNSVTSGESIRFVPGIYTVTETNLPGYTRTFTGNCDANGRINHGGIATHDDVCTVVNNDIGAPAVAPVPPLIDVVKVPSPLALPAGSGSVTYTYTVKNIGTVPMTDVTLIGDTCSPIILASGDTNVDSKLDVSETWVYRCTKTLTQTTKNTVVATGWANGINAIDVASATVVVGLPVVPPLIHITKVPYPLTLPGGAGMVTYTKKVTNPGTVVLSNVSVTDDKCTPITYISGDMNSDSKLDTTETWTYLCQANLTKTTTNTAIATGTANGLTATDFALATVAVAVPKLPNTGFPPRDTSTPWNIAALVGIFMIVSTSLVFVLKKNKI